MSDYSPKHGGASADNSNKPESGSGKKNTKILIISVVAILAAVIVVALVAILNNGSDPIFGLFSSNSQDGTTSLSKYYPGGVTPTTGSRHDVSLISGGGADAAEIAGLWKIDDITSYEFDGLGRGIMHTAVDRYTFRYSAENGKLDVDFDIDNAMDAEFTYKISGGTMTMSRNGVDYKMTKE